MQNYIEKIIMENNDTVECLVIKPGSIKDISWFDPNYAYKLMELNLFETVKINSDNFIKVIATHLETEKYKVKNLNVINEIIGDEPNYVYEMLYVDLEKDTNYNKPENLNELASLININGEQIYSNAIIIRNFLSSETNSMVMAPLTKKNLGDLLHHRVHTKVVIWDDKWAEDIVVGDLNNYAENFFDDKFEKMEFGFLLHNINIWYSTKSDGNTELCGKLLQKPIDKCLWFSMKSDEYRGNLTLDEVKKIIYLSNKLDNYNTPSEYQEEKTDELDRKIIYNKYKVLDIMYNKNKCV
jgi:hypothetical protein